MDIQRIDRTETFDTGEELIGYSLAAANFVLVSSVLYLQFKKMTNRVSETSGIRPDGTSSFRSANKRKRSTFGIKGSGTLPGAQAFPAQLFANGSANMKDYNKSIHRSPHRMKSRVAPKDEDEDDQQMSQMIEMVPVPDIEATAPVDEAPASALSPSDDPEEEKAFTPRDEEERAELTFTPAPRAAAEPKPTPSPEPAAKLAAQSKLTQQVQEAKNSFIGGLSEAKRERGRRLAPLTTSPGYSPGGSPGGLAKLKPLGSAAVAPTTFTGLKTPEGKAGGKKYDEYPTPFVRAPPAGKGSGLASPSEAKRGGFASP